MHRFLPIAMPRRLGSAAKQSCVTVARTHRCAVHGAREDRGFTSDAATAGYSPGLVVDGIPLLDRVWLDLVL